MKAFPDTSLRKPYLLGFLDLVELEHEPFSHFLRKTQSRS
jgi:hypothetical protein